MVSFTRMVTQALAVVNKAVGASHQNSTGVPNQHNGATIRNMTGIHLEMVHRGATDLQVDMTVSSGNM